MTDQWVSATDRVRDRIFGWDANNPIGQFCENDPRANLLSVDSLEVTRCQKFREISFVLLGNLLELAWKALSWSDCPRTEPGQPSQGPGLPVLGPLRSDNNFWGENEGGKVHLQIKSCCKF